MLRPSDKDTLQNIIATIKNMLQPLKITLVICYTVLVLSVAGVLLSGILGRLEWLALCAVCALALLSITLVLGKNLRIQRMMTEDEYSDDQVIAPHRLSPATIAKQSSEME